MPLRKAGGRPSRCNQLGAQHHRKIKHCSAAICGHSRPSERWSCQECTRISATLATTTDIVLAWTMCTAFGGVHHACWPQHLRSTSPAAIPAQVLHTLQVNKRQHASRLAHHLDLLHCEAAFLIEGGIALGAVQDDFVAACLLCRDNQLLDDPAKDKQLCVTR